MYIVCRDALGIFNMAVDETVLFLDGKAYFVSDGEDMEVPIENVVEIGRE